MTVSSDFSATHSGVAIDVRGGIESIALSISSFDDAVANDRGGFAGALFGHLFEVDGLGFDMEIDSIEQWAGDSVEVVLDFSGIVSAFLSPFRALPEHSLFQRNSCSSPQ